MKETLAKYGFGLMLAVIMFGCSPTGKVPRKKLPDMLESDAIIIPDQMQQTGNLFAWGTARKRLVEPTNEMAALCAPANNLHGNRQDANETASCNITEATIAGKSYYRVQITGSANDSALLNFVQSYRPFAGSVIDMLLNNGREGALIDFSSTDGNGTERAEFLVKNARGQSFTVVFVWDRLSAGRASIFMNELQQLPGIISTRIDSNQNF